MKILYFHQHFSTPSGSSGTRSYELARRLMQRGHEVTMVTGRHPGGGFEIEASKNELIRRGTVEGIQVIQIDIPYSNHDGLLKRSQVFLRFAFHSVRIALRESYDLLFATSTPLTAALPGIVAKWFRRKPFVFEVRDLWPELPKAMGVISNPLIIGMLRLLERTAYRSADGLIGLSPGIVEGIGAVNGLRCPVVMIPNAADTEFFKPSDRHGSGLTAVFTGAHGMANGLDAVLNTAQVLKERGRSDIRIELIGDGKHKAGLVERARQEGLENCCFLEPVPKWELAEKLAGADVGLMILANVPAFYTGTSPNKFFDYLSAGLPVLNNYPGWLAELISDHGCGMAVPPDDPQAFADALIWLADHPDARERMGKAARNLAEQTFSRDKLAEQFVRFLESVGSHNE